MGLLFLESGTSTFWLGLLLFIKRESRTPTFKILVRTLVLCQGRRSQATWAFSAAVALLVKESYVDVALIFQCVLPILTD